MRKLPIPSYNGDWYACINTEYTSEISLYAHKPLPTTVQVADSWVWVKYITTQQVYITAAVILRFSILAQGLGQHVEESDSAVFSKGHVRLNQQKTVMWPNCNSKLDKKACWHYVWPWTPTVTLTSLHLVRTWIYGKIEVNSIYWLLTLKLTVSGMSVLCISRASFSGVTPTPQPFLPSWGHWSCPSFTPTSAFTEFPFLQLHPQISTRPTQ